MKEQGACAQKDTIIHIQSQTYLMAGAPGRLTCSTLASDQPLVYLATRSGQVNLGIVKLLVKCISGSLWMCLVKDMGPSQTRILGPSLVWPSHFHHWMTWFLLPLGPWSRDSTCQPKGKQIKGRKSFPCNQVFIDILGKLSKVNPNAEPKLNCSFFSSFLESLSYNVGPLK